jgi:hypothetical protein
MKKFEYKVEENKYDTDVIEYLNNQGSEGWELVHTLVNGIWIDYYWKREIIESKYIETDPNL